MKNKKMAPIGVFDSGVGGLTVAREISRQLPYENIVYFGDTARVPYGSKSQNTIIRFSEQIIRFLRTKQVKAIVIACNTASALALDAVKDEFDLPIIGVVIPGARAAVEATTNGKVGVVGTEATVQSGMYTKVIQGMNPKIEVIEKACPLFVPLVEEGFKEHIVTREIIEYYLESMRNTDIDAMILGCTHYPLLRSKIREYMGDKIQIVNPAYETAMDLKRLLEEEEMANDETTEHHSEYSFMTKDVLVSISGMHEEIVAVTPEVEDENEAIEVVTPATYYLKNGKHYIVYEEVVEGTSGVIKNRIKINGDECVEIVKSGLSNSHMIFEKNKKNQTFYKTPYGQMLIGVNTRHLQVDFEEDKIAVQIDYELDVNHEPMADCKIRMNIVSKDSGKFSVLS